MQQTPIPEAAEVNHHTSNEMPTFEQDDKLIIGTS